MQCFLILSVCASTKLSLSFFFCSLLHLFVLVLVHCGLSKEQCNLNRIQKRRRPFSSDTQMRIKVSWKAGRGDMNHDNAKQQCDNKTTGQGALCGLLIRTATCPAASIKPCHQFTVTFQKHLIKGMRKRNWMVAFKKYHTVL